MPKYFKRRSFFEWYRKQMFTRNSSKYSSESIFIVISRHSSINDAVSIVTAGVLILEINCIVKFSTFSATPALSTKVSFDAAC